MNFKLPGDIKPRLEIEKFCDKITRSLYSNRRDPVGLSSDQERLTIISFLSRDFDELEEQFKSQKDCKTTVLFPSLLGTNRRPGITDLYLRAANLHLHLSAFFDDPSAKDYRGRLLSLYVATTSFLEAAMNLETEVGPVLSYTPYYVYQMMVAAGCTLLKLSKSFFSNHIDMEYTKTLFNRTIWAIRGVSVSNNDLPERLAEVLAQMWRLGVTSKRSTTSKQDVDDSLRLKVRCRMSMSLLFDSVWRWREDARTKGRNIEGQSIIHMIYFGHTNSVQPTSRTRPIQIQQPTHLLPHLWGSHAPRHPHPVLPVAIQVWHRPRYCQTSVLEHPLMEPVGSQADSLNPTTKCLIHSTGSSTASSTCHIHIQPWVEWRHRLHRSPTVLDFQALLFLVGRDMLVRLYHAILNR